MKMGIIGAGQIGGTLTRRLTALGLPSFSGQLTRSWNARRLGRRNRRK